MPSHRNIGLKTTTHTSDAIFKTALDLEAQGLIKADRALVTLTCDQLNPQYFWVLIAHRFQKLAKLRPPDPQFLLSRMHRYRQIR